MAPSRSEELLALVQDALPGPEPVHGLGLLSPEVLGRLQAALVRLRIAHRVLLAPGRSAGRSAGRSGAQRAPHVGSEAGDGGGGGGGRRAEGEAVRGAPAIAEWRAARSAGGGLKWRAVRIAGDGPFLDERLHVARELMTRATSTNVGEITQVDRDEKSRISQRGLCCNGVDGPSLAMADVSG